jgi:hypothetical protein
LLAPFGCSLFFHDKGDSPAPEDVVKVNIRAEKVGDLGFVKALPKGVTGVILVSQDNTKANVPIITPVSVDPLTQAAQPINLCAPTSELECDVVTSSDALMRTLSATNTDAVGYCKVGAKIYQCHTAGPNIGKRRWHQSPDSNAHYQCESLCKPPR